MNFEAMPQELQECKRWLLWRARGGRKIPYKVTRPERTASPTDPATWAAFHAARESYSPQRDNGVGYVLNGDGIAAIDIDHNTDQKAIDLLREAGCGYIERSPSGNGLHGWGYFDGELPRKKGEINGISVEIYKNKRYMTVTGDAVLRGEFTPMRDIEALSRSLKPIVASFTQETQDTKETQETHDTQESQVSGGVLGPEELAKFVPPKTHLRNKYLFELARHLKAVAPSATAEMLRATVTLWHELSLPTISTKEFSVTWGDFLRGWNSVKFPEGVVMDAIMNGVKDDAPPPGLPDDYGDQAVLLASVCRRLQRNADEAPFFLSARMAGSLIGVTHTTAASMLYAMVGDEVLELIEHGQLEGRRATTYRWLLKP